MSHEGPDELALVAKAQVGDRAAFAELYDRHVRPVYWQAYSVVRNRDAAEDVTQEVFITAWRRIRAITPVDGSLLPWLLLTARYTAYNTARREQRRSHGRSPRVLRRQAGHPPREPHRTAPARRVQPRTRRPVRVTSSA